MFNEETAKLSGKKLTGEFAFKLYDTYGFPLTTQLMAREADLSVDTTGFESLMQKQRERARSAQKKEVISVSNVSPKRLMNLLDSKNLRLRPQSLRWFRTRSSQGLCSTSPLSTLKWEGKLVTKVF